MDNILNMAFGEGFMITAVVLSIPIGLLAGWAFPKYYATRAGHLNPKTCSHDHLTWDTAICKDCGHIFH